MKITKSEISFLDIPSYSSIPKKIIFSSADDIKLKTPMEITREYEHERWGKILQIVKEKKIASLEYVESLHANPVDQCISYIDGKFYLSSEREMLVNHLNLYEKHLRKYIDNASCIVELGAGYGSKIMQLSKRPFLKGKDLYAAEFTQSGQELIRTVSEFEKINIQVGYCDLRMLEVDKIQIPENALIFTSYSAHYVPLISKYFVEFLASFKPTAVVHFEPIYEFFDQNDLHGLMCKRYIELNDYSTNLWSTLKHGCDAIGCPPPSISPNLLGSNPFLPISAIEWSI